jgi:hypothetical protein
MHVGCSMERGRHSGTAEGRRVRNRPCDVAHRSEVCGTLEDLTVRVWRRLRSVCCVVPVGRWGLAGAARGSTERSHHPCSRARVPVFGRTRRTTGVRSMHRRRRGCRVDRTGNRCSVCADATCGRYRTGTWARAAGVSAPCWRHRRCSAAVPVRVCLACVLCARGALAGPGAEPRGPCVAVQAAGRLCVAAGTDSDVEPWPRQLDRKLDRNSTGYSTG